MDSSDITKCIIIFFVFILIYFAVILSTGIKTINNNWAEYKCNPIVMPFAKFFNKNPEKNFEECIKNLQEINMGPILSPINSLIDQLDGNSQGIFNSFNIFSGITNLLKQNIGNHANIAIEIAISILIELQFIFIKLKDIFGKVTGIFTTFMYIMITVEKTMITLWGSIPGWIIKKLANYHPSKDKDKDNDSDDSSGGDSNNSGNN